MATKKKQEFVFPPNSCGACHWMHIPEEDHDEYMREQIGVCYALPPICTYDGHDITPARPNLGFNEPACLMFKPRSHA